MSTTHNRIDGLYISTHATWPQLAADETLRHFANGLIPMALHQKNTSSTLAELLHHTGPQTYPLLTALLVLDAEVNAVVDGKEPVFPLAGFLTYRTRLSPEKFPLNTVRVPPLTPNGHYLLTITNDGFCTALRLDLHPHLNLAGHVRIAVSSPTRTPIRLSALEFRLERQTLTPDLIETAIAVTNTDLHRPLTQPEQTHLNEILQGLVYH
jgi:CO/xanthine dehydrogenase FAD-binding subunit